jgi:hypothetical protein
MSEQERAFAAQNGALFGNDELKPGFYLDTKYYGDSQFLLLQKLETSRVYRFVQNRLEAKTEGRFFIVATQKVD